MTDTITYHYYIHIQDTKEVIVRINGSGSIHKNVGSIEVYQQNGSWEKQAIVVKSFMTHYITGWIDENDKVDPDIIEEMLATGTTYKIIKARTYALQQHRNQKYGSFSYTIHLTAVVSTLLHFGVSKSKDDILIAAAWLHDVVEDTDTDLAYISSNFGEEVRSIIKVVSNQKNSKISKQENKTNTFMAIAENQQAIIVKLADRIANVEFSLLHGTIDKLDKYKNEQLLIDTHIAPKIGTDIGKKMYTHLKKLIDKK